jgi:hypothetical protein
MTRDFIIDELPLSQGFAMLAWARLNNGFVSMEIAGDGYIAQERWKNSCQSDVLALKFEI